MPDGISKEDAQYVAELAIREYQKASDRSKKERHDRNLRNTKKLMRIYPLLRAHSNSSIAELSSICDDEAIDVLLQMMSANGSGDVKVESIQRSAARTRIMIDHIDTMLEVFQLESERSRRDEARRRYRVLSSMYLDDKRMDADQIADREGIDKRTVYKDIDFACERLSYYIFGIDAF
ncbi:MAG: hypothetical protein RSC06_00910 [Clostridia bacterium]